MFKFLSHFQKAEDGAVTVDFVVLTAAIVILGLAVGTTISNGAITLAEEQGAELGNRELGTDWYRE